MKTLIHIVGARPNFMKLAPVYNAIKEHRRFEQIVVHTGQHYSQAMSSVFFSELGLGQPEYNLNVGSDTHARQVAKIMMTIEKVFAKEKPDGIIVYGDVNSTMAASLVASKMQIPVVHVEAGLRSFDHTMPEEINRVVTDRLSDILFTPSADCSENLRKEGIPRDKIFLVGNVMIDTLTQFINAENTSQALKHIPETFALVTLHRPSNVDDANVLSRLLNALSEIAEITPLIFPVHPRTQNKIRENTSLQSNNLILMDPLSYTAFIQLMKHAKFVITDSGGVQEETTYLGIPCLTLRGNTERPVTIKLGTNKLIGNDLNSLKKEVDQIVLGKSKKGSIPPLWDGKASQRIAQILYKKI